MPTTSTLLGALTGMVLSLSVAVLVVMAGNGQNNPGMGEAQIDAIGGQRRQRSLAAPGSARDSFGSLDLNGDGCVSLAEAAGYGDIMTRFARADRNKDGKLTKVEFERLAKLPPPKPRPKPKLRLREDAAAALASAPREERRSP